MVAKARKRQRSWKYVYEKDFQRAIEEYAQLCGWAYYQTYDSRRSNAGFPDLTLVRGNRLIFAELKSPRGKVRPAQVEWLARLDQVPAVEVYLWRPSDWPDIEKLLR